jgi:hypothetical protein
MNIKREANKLYRKKEVYIAITLLYFLIATFIASVLSNWEIVFQSPVVIRKAEFKRMIVEETKREIMHELVEVVVKDAIEEELKKQPTTTPEARKQTFVPQAEGSISHVINKWAKHYKVSTALAHCIAFKESSYRTDAIGDGGKALGLFQWHKPSWEFMRAKMGESTEDKRDCPEEATKTAMYAISKGYLRWWTTARFCGGNV